jgi:hypothetical protein
MKPFEGTWWAFDHRASCEESEPDFSKSCKKSFSGLEKSWMAFENAGVTFEKVAATFGHAGDRFSASRVFETSLAVSSISARVASSDAESRGQKNVTRANS